MRLEVIAREPRRSLDRAPLLFVHGACHAAWCWAEHFLDYFADHGYCAHALSLRGHGRSEGKQKIHRASIADYVLDLAQVAESLSRSPVVVGHSLGGLVVQKYLETHHAPAAVLLAPPLFLGRARAGFYLLWRVYTFVTKTFLTKDARKLYENPAFIRELLFSESFDRVKIEQYAGRFEIESLRALFGMLFYLPKPRRVKSPVLVLGAENDLIAHPRAIEKVGCAYQAKVKVFPNMAHDMMLEDDWKNVADFILKWLEAKDLQNEFARHP